MTDATRHDHDDLHELLVPFVLGQLEAVEHADVEAALEHDPDLRAALAEIEATGLALVAGLPRHRAPASVRTSVMAAVHASADDAAATEREARSRPTFMPARPRSRWRRLALPAMSGALATACVVLAVVAIGLDRDLDDATSRVDDLQQAIDDMPRGAPAGFDRATTMTVDTTDEFSSASGSLIRVSDDKWLLAFNDVPEPAQGRSWQVWTAASDGTIRNVAQWADGDAQLLVLDSNDIVEVMVSYEPTVEPAPEPSSLPVADIKL